MWNSLYNGTSDDSDEVRHGLHDGVTTHYVSGRPNVVSWPYLYIKGQNNLVEYIVHGYNLKLAGK